MRDVDGVEQLDLRTGGSRGEDAGAFTEGYTQTLDTYITKRACAFIGSIIGQIPHQGYNTSD